MTRFALPRWLFIPATFLLLTLPIGADAQVRSADAVLELRTHAEATNWQEITSHESMVEFYRSLTAHSDQVRIREFGRSPEGRPLLEVVVSRSGFADPWEAHASGKAIVLINGLVHGDEPAGKEGIMLLARDLVGGDLNHLLDNVVFVISPELNPDGGASGDWGTRNNTRNRNVNRDYLRLVNPETRAFVSQVIAPWRPHVVVDAHELVGPPRIYDFYTSFPRDIAGPTLAYDLTRDGIVPAIIEAVETAGFSHFPYHRVPSGLAENPSQGVSAGSYGARALSSYGGAQAGATILYESMRPRDARLGLEDRIHRQHVALRAMAEYVADHSATVVRTVGEERAELVRRGSRWDPADSVAIELEQVSSQTLDYRVLIDGDTLEFPVPLLDSTVVTMGRVRPVAYLIEPHREEAARHLSLHGIQVERLLSDTRVPGESYHIEAVDRDSTPYEGYVTRHFTTTVEEESIEARAGSFVVRMDQPEARIIAHLLEPEDGNSLSSMGWFTTEERSGTRHSVHRLQALPEAPTEVMTAVDHRGAPRWLDHPRPPSRLAARQGASAEAIGASPLESITPHEEVVSFFEDLTARSSAVQMQTIGMSREGLPLHLVTMGNPSVKSPWEAHASGRPILFIGGQVHGDEPAGMQGLLQFARDLVDGPLNPLLDEIIFLFVPQMNPDGGESGDWGTRANRAGYNLNRDYLVMDNPETRAIVQSALVPWRPHVVVDAHELAGPPRVYDFYTWHPTNPHGPATTKDLAGEALIPAIVDALESAGYSHIIYHTPGTLGQLADDPEVGIHVPVYGRTLNDYAASQGMATILYESLRERDARIGIDDRARRHRIAMEALATAMAEDGDRIVNAFVEGAAEMRGRGSRWSEADSIAVLREPIPSRTVEYQVAERVRSAEGDGWEFSGEILTVETPVYDSSRVSLGRIRPEGYLIEPQRDDIVQELLDHGVQVERVLEEGTWQVESFRVDAIELSGAGYEGYVPQRFRSSLEPDTTTLPAGSFYVRAAQPGAALIFHLMEPEDENSLAITGAFMSEAREGRVLPVHRVVNRPDVQMQRISPQHP